MTQRARERERERERKAGLLRGEQIKCVNRREREREKKTGAQFPWSRLLFWATLALSPPK